jgi:hypothetical protein
MKSKISSTLLAALLAVTVIFAPMQKSHAAIGGLIWLFGGTEVVAIVGGGTVLGGYIWALIEAEVGNDEWAGLRGIAFALLGLYILDEDGQQSMNYGHLEEEQIANLGITKDQARVFNGQLEEVNAVKDTIASTVGQLENPSFEDVQGLWQEHSGVLAPETMVVVDKISQALQESLK